MKSSAFLTRRSDVEDLESFDGEVRLLSIQDSSPASSNDEIGGAYMTISERATERERRSQQNRQAQR